MIDTLYALAHWLLDQQRVEDAIHVFRTMMHLAPDDERSWLGVAYCHELRGEDALAERLYELAEKAVPRSFRLPLALARLRRRTNDVFADAAYELAQERASALDEDELVRSIDAERRAA